MLNRRSATPPTTGRDSATFDPNWCITGMNNGTLFANQGPWKRLGEFPDRARLLRRDAPPCCSTHALASAEAAEGAHTPQPVPSSGGGTLDESCRCVPHLPPQSAHTWPSGRSIQWRDDQDTEISRFGAVTALTLIAALAGCADAPSFRLHVIVRPARTRCPGDSSAPAASAPYCRNSPMRPKP